MKNTVAELALIKESLKLISEAHFSVGGNIDILSKSSGIDVNILRLWFYEPISKWSDLRPNTSELEVLMRITDTAELVRDALTLYDGSEEMRRDARLIQSGLDM